MITLSLQDIRFLLSRSRGQWLPEELNGLAPLGPTGLRHVEGFGNNTTNQLAPNWWNGAADMLFPRMTFNRLNAVGLKNDVISAPFANATRGPAQKIVINNTATVTDPNTGVTKIVDALNPRNISNLVADSSNPAGFQSLDPTDPNYQAKLQLKLMDNPYNVDPVTGVAAPRVSPVSGVVNPLAYSNWTSQFAQFFDHGLDFVSKGVDGKVQVNLLASDGLATTFRATSINASRSNTANVTIGEGSTDVLLSKLGIALNTQETPSWNVSTTLTKPSVTGTTVAGSIYAYEGTLVLNNTLIKIAAIDEIDLVSQINAFSPTTGVVATISPFPAIPGFTEPGAFQFSLTPARAESFNQASPFIDLSQAYGSDNSRTIFLKEYLSEGAWRTLTNNAGVEATVNDLTTGRLVNAGVNVNGIVGEAGIANWAQIKANALNIGIVLHDADITGIPLVAVDKNGQLILDANGMPQLVALNKVTGEIVYVKDTTLANDANIQARVADLSTDWAASDFVLMTTKHAFLNDMALPLPPLGGPGWNGRDLVDNVNLGPPFGIVNFKTVLEAHYVAGDGRLNENIGLTAVQEVFVNEHNRMIDLLKQQYGFTGDQPVGGWTWTDPQTNVTTQVTGEELFQQAKLFNEMTYQHLVFDQFVRKLSPNIAAFAGVNTAIVANVPSEFANAVYRLGHSMLPEAVGIRKVTDASAISTTAGQTTITVAIADHGLKVGNTVTIADVDTSIGGIAAANLNGDFVIASVTQNTLVLTLRAGTPAATGTATGVLDDKLYVDIDRGLIDAFLSPQSYKPGYTAGLLADGSTAQVANRIDEKVTDALRDNLLGQPLDLATLNLVRGRDAGLPTLNEMRASIQAIAPLLLQPTLNAYNSWSSFRDNLKGTIADQIATVKNFIMAYASDAILEKFGATGSSLDGVAGRSLADWYTLRASTDPVAQADYMKALKAATNAAYADGTWMGTTGNQDFNHIDAWIGGLAEREVAGGMLGSTFDAVFAMTMMNLQNADHFYYLGRVPATEFFQENIEGNQFSDIVMRATGATNLYGDIFSVADEYLQMDTAQQPQNSFATIAALDASTTTQQNLFDTNGNVISASVGHAGYVGGVFYGNGGNYVDARGVLNPNGVGNESEMIAGTAGNDTVFARGGNDTVRAGLGDDIINGESGVDFLYGDEGNDVMDGGAENDFMYGGVGNDTMRGGIALDTMFGNDGNDLMYGGQEADVMTGGAGNDIMFGGDGLVDPGNGILVPFDPLNPLLGVLDPLNDIVPVLLDDVMSGGAGDDILYGGGGWDALNGNSGHDILVPGTAGSDPNGREVMDGGHGDDIYILEDIRAYDFMNFADTGLSQAQLVNKDSYRVGNGIGIDELRITDTVANALILGQAVNGVGVVIPAIFTGIERVVIGTGMGITADRTGTAAIDIDAQLVVTGINEGLEILGNAGANNIIGTNFDDVIDGGGGVDTLTGLIGNDTYILDNVADTVSEVGGGGRDKVVIAGDFNYTLAADFEDLTLQGTLAGQSGTGNALDNVIIGSGVANTLNGDAGNDRVIGGGGADTLTGGLGSDTFVFSNGDSGNTALTRDTITDFVVGADLIDLTAIDANTLVAGHQSFNYGSIGTAFAAAGTPSLRYTGGILSGDTNGDRVADFQIALTGNPALTSASFVANPIVSIARSSIVPAGGLNEGNAGTVNHAFTVTLSKPVLVDTIVGWSVTGTSAGLDAADFVNPLAPATLPSGTVKILAGQTTGTIMVPVRGDTVVEANETFQVTLANPVGGAILGTSVASSTIVDDDKINVISLAGPGGGGIAEGNSGTSRHTFTVNLSSAATVATSVAYVVTGTGANPVNAADFAAGQLSGLVMIAAGATSATFTVDVAGDTQVEANEAFAVTITNPTVGTVINPGAMTATSIILNDDTAVVPVIPPVVPPPVVPTPVVPTPVVPPPVVPPEPTPSHVPGITITGTSKGQVHDGTANDDIIFGMGGKDTLNGKGGYDTLDGGAGNDTLNGDEGNDILFGGAGNDIMKGGDGNDTLNGGAGRDTLDGGNGIDFLFGSAARDIMTGGAGNDVFHFSANIKEIGKNLASNDQILDFTHGQDQIDLSAIDASSAAGVQHFEFIGDAAFTGLGQLRYENGQLQGNVNGNNGSDFTITLVNAPASLVAGDFIL